MLPDMLLPPYTVEYQAMFLSRTAIDNRDLTALTLFAGGTPSDYSNQSPSGFDFTRDNITVLIQGDDFVYDGGVPTAGLVTSFDVLFGNTLAYEWGVLSSSGEENSFTGLPISLFLTATDPQALAGVLFATDDSIRSTGFNGDRLYGFDGDDRINGANGENRLYGGNGDDWLEGGRHNDRLYGDAGNDFLDGGRGDDVLNGGEGVDTAYYFLRTAPIELKLKNEKTAKAFVGFNEVDKLKGVENAYGSLAADKLTGDKGNNQFDGDAGNDVLNGKGGNDILAGGYGLDMLCGGSGNDIFMFDKLPALGGGIINIDTIKDFQSGVDDIYLRQLIFSELDAGVLSAENFLAAPGAIGGITGEQFIVYNTLTGALYYDPSGEGTAGPMIFQFATLKGAPQLSAADITVFASKYDADLDV
jgi:Ca2+-binding RTX toxin-like protein